MSSPMPEIDHPLHDTLVALVREHGPLDLRTLTHRARVAAGRPDLDASGVAALVETGTLLVVRPDGRITYLGDVLDGIVLTHRVRGSLRGRTDLWLGRGVQPFLTMAVIAPLPLVSGGAAADQHEHAHGQGRRHPGGHPGGHHRGMYMLLCAGQPLSSCVTTCKQGAWRAWQTPPNGCVTLASSARHCLLPRWKPMR